MALFLPVVPLDQAPLCYSIQECKWLFMEGEYTRQNTPAGTYVYVHQKGDSPFTTCFVIRQNEDKSFERYVFFPDKYEGGDMTWLKIIV